MKKQKSNIECWLVLQTVKEIDKANAEERIKIIKSMLDDLERKGSKGG